MWLVVLIGADLDKINVVVVSLWFNRQNAAFYRRIMLPYWCMSCCLCNSSKLLMLYCLIWKMLLALSVACLDTKESWNESNSRFLWHVCLKMVTGWNLHALTFVQDRNLSLMLCVSVTLWCYLLGFEDDECVCWQVQILASICGMYVEYRCRAVAETWRWEWNKAILAYPPLSWLINKCRFIRLKKEYCRLSFVCVFWVAI
jgi:hypothetical protein